ncbi:MAG: 2Fe-2S iron-sulfur cluster-binding protein, partial [Rhizomicrobium sp.]
MALVEEIDLGTPARRSAQKVTLTIDGRRVTAPAGTSIMRAAAELGTQIPNLFSTDSLEDFCSCRICLIEIEGRPGTPSSCTTPVAEGMI